jgi:hypothetical protein
MTRFAACRSQDVPAAGRLPPGWAHDLFRVSVTIVTLTRNKSQLLTGTTGKPGIPGGRRGTSGHGNRTSARFARFAALSRRGWQPESQSDREWCGKYC